MQSASKILMALGGILLLGLVTDRGLIRICTYHALTF